MALGGVLVSSTVGLDADEVQFSVRSHVHRDYPYVVLGLGSHNLSMHVYDLATLTALAATVAEAKDLLTAALAGQDRLPVDPALVSA